MGIGPVERDQHRIEVEPPHGFQEDGRVVVAGQTEEANTAFRTRLDECLERTAPAEDRVQVAGVRRSWSCQRSRWSVRSRSRLSSSSRSEPSRVRSWVLDARKTWPRRSPRAAP